MNTELIQTLSERTAGGEYITLELFAKEVVYEIVKMIPEADNKKYVFTTHDKGVVDAIVERIQNHILEQFDLPKRYERLR